MRTHLCAKVTLPALLISIFLTNSLIYAVNGKAISVAVRFSEDEKIVPESHWSYRGKIVRFDITDNQVDLCDTIYDGLGEFPSINMDGTRVTFFRDGDSVADSTLVRSGYDWLSVMDIDGSNLRDIVRFGDGNVAYGNIAWNGVHDRSTDWPFGKWIYYVYPKKNEIWRINPDDTTEHELVITFEYSSGVESGYIRRWILSADASKIGIQWKDAEPPANGAFKFPWDPDSIGLLTGQQRFFMYCNVSMAPSGNYVTAYDGHCHCTFPVAAVDWATNTYTPVRVREQAGLDDIIRITGRDSVGKGGEYIRWAANSDKWVLQQVGWQGHDLNVTFCGSNQILWNWVDDEAIITSDNPSNNACASDGTIAYSNSAGDFWVEGPLGCVEDSSGNWIPVEYQASGIKDNKLLPFSKTTVSIQNMVYNTSNMVFDIRGRRISSLSIQDLKRSPNSGIYVVENSNTNQDRVFKRLFIAK